MRQWEIWEERALTDRLRERAGEMGIELSDHQLAQFEAYAAILVEWNEKMNLTAITDPEEILEKHFLDSLSGGPLIEELMAEPGEALSIIDIGTGAGFPGIPLKIAYPGLELTLLDSLNKRIGFLNEVVSELGLTGVTCLHDRAEEAAHREELREQFDIAVSRAVASLPVLLEYCTPYVHEDGLFLAYKGPTMMEELAASRNAMKKLCLELSVLHQEMSMDNDHFIGVFVKTGETALQYPRKQSKIKNDPL